MESSAVLLIVIILIIARLVANSWKNNDGPPHPPRWPIIGHLHLLKKNQQPPHRSLAWLSQQYGPVMLLRFGCRPVLVISSWDAARDCFTTNDRAFASRPRLAAARHLGYDSCSLGLAPYGEYWRNIRKICVVEILSAKRIEALKHVRTEEIHTFIRSLFQSCHEQVNMKSRLSELTFNTIVRMVLGGKRQDFVAHARELRKFIEETFFLHGVFNVGDYIPILSWLDVQGYERAMKNLHKRRDALIQTLVDEHRHRRSAEQEEDELDFIDVLLSAAAQYNDTHPIHSRDDRVVKSTALGMISAGTDTAAVTMEWALASLLQRPQMLKKAHEELDREIGRDRVVEESDLPKLKYLQAIVKETLRLYPAAPLLVPHASTEECWVGGYRVPAGTHLLVNAWAIHRDPAVWERPLEFDPERFLEGGGVDIDVRGQHLQLIPFGSGRRACPGISLGLCIVQLTLARLLHSFQWFLPPGTTIDMTEGLGLIMPKATALESLITPRLPLHLY